MTPNANVAVEWRSVHMLLWDRRHTNVKRNHRVSAIIPVHRGPGIAPLFVYRNLWGYMEGGGESKYGTVWKLQGGSNMTGTDCLQFTHKSVPVIFEPPCMFTDFDGRCIVSTLLLKMKCSNVGIRDTFTELSLNNIFHFLYYVTAVHFLQLTSCSPYCARFVDDRS